MLRFGCVWFEFGCFVWLVCLFVDGAGVCVNSVVMVRLFIMELALLF